MYFIPLLIIPLVLFRLGFRKTLLVYGLCILSAILLVLSFSVGAFATLWIDPETVRLWTIPDSWVTQIVDSRWFYSNLWVAFLLPMVLVGDIFRWVLYINIFFGNPILWLSMIVGLITVGVAWYSAIKAYVDTRKNYA
jgi:hypothetical protein